MIGIKFKIKNQYDTFLYKILKGIDSDQFKWQIVEQEIYKEDGSDLFENDCYPNQQWKQLINQDPYYTVFANIQLYQKNGLIRPISHYDDFQKSDCILILLITDNEFVDIYAKDEALLQMIQKNAIQFHFSEIEFILSPKKTFSAYTD